MLGKNTRLIGKLLGELAVSLPLSLITKLADGRLTSEELQALIREITVIVARVVIAEYREQGSETDLVESEFIEEDI